MMLAYGGKAYKVEPRHVKVAEGSAEIGYAVQTVPLGSTFNRGFAVVVTRPQRKPPVGLELNS